MPSEPIVVAVIAPRLLSSRCLVSRRVTTLLLAVAVLIGGRVRAEERRQIPDSIPSPLRAATVMGRAASDASLRMSLTMRIQHEADLERLLAEQQRPGSVDYHRWLTPGQFAARFAPAAEDYAAVVSWLRSQGFAVTTSPTRLRVDFAGTVDQTERAFAVRMQRYAHREREVLANETAASLPTALAELVQTARLTTMPLAHPLIRVTGPSGALDTMAPADVHSAYAVAPVLAAGIDGSGQTIAVVARSDFMASDVSAFQSHFGVPLRSPAKFFPAGNPGIGSPNWACAGIHNATQRQMCLQDEETEVLLDTEWAGAMAPGAAVLVDVSDADIDVSLLDVVNHHPDAKIISISFGSCERLDTGALQTVHPMYLQAAAQGQTVLVATGDNGPDECVDGGSPSVNALASDANVTAVGGTALDAAFDASGHATGYAGEAVWNDADGASGGGVSKLVAKPAYQNGPGVPADGFRDLPDVALLASPSGSGYIIVVENQLAIVGGTSAGTPNWAGIVALLNDAVHADGLGALNPLLYDLARLQFSGSGTAVFHDVTTGSTTFDQVPGFNATAGFDLATGWGSPDTERLVQAVQLAVASPTPTPTPTSSRVPTPTRSPTPTSSPTPSLGPTAPESPTAPPSPCVGDCQGAGVVSVNDLITLVDIALGTLPVSACTAGDADHDGAFTVAEIVSAVNAALAGCPP